MSHTFCVMVRNTCFELGLISFYSLWLIQFNGYSITLFLKKKTIWIFKFQFGAFFVLLWAWVMTRKNTVSKNRFYRHFMCSIKYTNKCIRRDQTLRSHMNCQMEFITFDWKYALNNYYMQKRFIELIVVQKLYITITEKKHRTL